MNYLTSAIMIVSCAGAAAAIAWILVSWLDLSGVVAGLTMVFAAMVVATALFAGAVALGRALRLLK